MPSNNPPKALSLKGTRGTRHGAALSEFRTCGSVIVEAVRAALQEYEMPQVKITIDETQYARLKESADEDGLPLAVYCRGLILSSQSLSELGNAIAEARDAVIETHKADLSKVATFLAERIGSTK